MAEWTEIATAPFGSPAGASLSMHLSVRVAEELPDEITFDEITLDDGGVMPTTPVPAAARVVAADGFMLRVGQPDAHVLAEHAPSIVECSLLGLAPDALAGRADADIRLDVVGTAPAGGPNWVLAPYGQGGSSPSPFAHDNAGAGTGYDPSTTWGGLPVYRLRPGSGGAYNFVQYGGVQLGASTSATWTFSVRIRRADAGTIGPVFTAIAAGGVFQGSTTPPTPLGGGWYLVTRTYTGAAGAVDAWGVDLNPGAPSAGGQDVFVAGWQLEQGAAPTGLVPATGGTALPAPVLYRGNVRAEDVRPGYGLGASPVKVFAYDGVERLASVPYTFGAQGLPAAALTLAETAAELLAPLGDGLPVVTLLGWGHTGQRTDIARARSIRADAGRWAVSSSTSDEPTYRDALKAFLVAFDLQLVQHATPASAPGGGGAVWLVVQRSIRTEALRVAAAGGAAAGGAASAFAAAWVTGAPGAWTAQDVAVANLGLATAVASGVSVGPSVPRPWTPVTRVASQHPTAQPGLVDEDMTEIAAGTGEGGTGGGPSIPPRPRWWQGVKLATGVATPAQIVKYAGEGDAGVFLGFGIGQPDAVYQQTVRWYAPGTALEIQIRKRTGSLAATGAKTSLRFGVVVAKTPGQPDLYLQPPTAPNVAPAWGTAYAYLSADVETPAASTSGPVDCRVVTAALPRPAQILVFVTGHAGRENSALAVSASVEPARGTAEVLGVEAAWPLARTSSASPRGREALVDVVGVGDLTGTGRGTAALSVQAAGGGWAEAAGAWRAVGGTGTALPLPVARVVDVAEQVGRALAGVDVVLPRPCLTVAGTSAGFGGVPWAGWLEWAGGTGPLRRLPACVETNLVTGVCRAVAYPLASGGVPASAVSVYRYSREGSVGPVEPPAPPAPPAGGNSS